VSAKCGSNGKQIHVGQTFEKKPAPDLFVMESTNSKETSFNKNEICLYFENAEWNKADFGMGNVIVKLLIIPQRNEELFQKVLWNTELPS
jgi:hypothetical protein